MSTLSLFNTKPCALLLVAFVSLGLFGCGNDTSRTEGSRIALDVARGLKAKAFARKQTPAKPDTEALAAVALGSFPGPLIMADLEATGIVSTLGEFGSNGDTRTYATPSQQTMTFRNGLLVATRGLGNDLMSADLGQANGLIPQRRGGAYTRVYRYLDGEAIERPLPFKCILEPGSANLVTFAGNTFATTRLVETCTTEGLTIKNDYAVTADGKIARSRQWIGPALGYVGITLLREE